MSSEIRLAVSGMTCAACATRLERVVQRIPASGQARVDFTTGVLAVDGPISLAALQEAVEQAGFTATPVNEASRDPDVRAELVRAAVAGVFGMQSMMVGLALASDGVPATMVTPLGVLAGVMSIPAVLWAGQPLARATFVSLRSGAIGVDALVGLGTALTWVASWLAVSAGRSEVWFDTAAMLVALHVGGRAIEGRVRRRATGAVRALVALAPDVALREGAEGLLEVPIAVVRPGDRVHVLAGARIPVDGLVRQGRSTVDRSLITGEPLPDTVGVGSLVEAGALNGDGVLVVEVLSAAGSRRIDRLAARVEQALAHRPGIVRAADRVATFLVPVVGVLASGAAAASLLRGEPLADALIAAATVVVVTCPCALTLAAPVAVAAAAGAAAEQGFLFRDADALEQLGAATAMWFDKTGTLTEGSLSVYRMHVVPELEASEAWEKGAALGATSRHPASRAVVAGRTVMLPAAGAQLVPGDGVEAEIEGHRWRLGRPGWAGAGPCTTEPAVDLARDGRFVARFILEDEVRSDARSTVEALRALDLDLRVLSGDPSDAVSAVGLELGLASRGSMSPEEKAEALASATAAGARIAFVGDGLNDTLAQATASVGVAPMGATDAAAASAGLLLLREGLGALPEAVRLARATRRVVRQNLGWAVAYNLVAVPLATLGYATPLLAAAAMTASSLTVTLNAARLLQHAEPKR